MTTRETLHPRPVTEALRIIRGAKTTLTPRGLGVVLLNADVDRLIELLDPGTDASRGKPDAARRRHAAALTTRHETLIREKQPKAKKAAKIRPAKRGAPVMRPLRKRVRDKLARKFR